MSVPLLNHAGTALTEKGRRTRQTVVAAAAELLHEQGVTATTLVDVRKATGVSSSQLYHYFSDKQDLVRAVVEHQVVKVTDHQREMNLSTLDAFREWKNAAVAEGEARNGQGGCPLGSLGAELSETDPVGRERIALGFQQWAGVIESGLGHMQDNKELLAGVDTHRLALGILAALQGGLLLGQVQRSTEALGAALDNVITLLETLRPDTE